jgi:dTDP-4-amino-4,6-dideoxygalactose transaminase
MSIPAIEGGQPIRQTYLVFGQPQIEEAEIEEVVDTLRSGWIGTGPKAQAFEEQFRKYVGRHHAAAIGSCTAALHLSMLASNIGPGDEVITTPLTFPATANAIIHAGARPVFADIEPESQNIDPNEIEKKISKKTRGLLPVHFAGRPCEMVRLLEVAQAHNLWVIEDCAHAIETRYQGQNAGTFGNAGCYSFYVTKNVVTIEGGMVVADDEEFISRIKVLSLHGMTRDAWSRFRDDGYKHYLVAETGYKFNMTDVQASLGIHQLNRVEMNHARRGEIWESYNRAFEKLPCKLPAPVDPGSRHARHLYTLLLELEALTIDRDTFLLALHKENIGAGVHYIPVHLHPYYRTNQDLRPGDFPNAEHVGERTVSLPLSARLTDPDVEDVIQAVIRILNHYQR